MDITTATKPDAKSGDMAESNMEADRDEDFNTRYGSFRGWQMAIERVKPIPRDTAQVNLSQHGAGRSTSRTPTQVVDYLIHRFMRVPPGDDARQKLVAFLNKELGTTDIAVAQTYHGRPAAAGAAPDHEPARVSVGLRSARHEEVIFRFRKPAAAICCAPACTASA